jgi:hypothetical protein
LEHEVVGEPPAVAFDLLIQAAHRHTVEHGQVGAQHYTVSTDDDYRLFDAT